MAKLKKNQTLSKKEKDLLETIPTKDIISEYKGLKKSFETREECEQFLCSLADDFLKTYFDMNLEIPILISPRMTSNLGLFYFTYTSSSRTYKTTKPNKIKISSKFFDYEQEDLRKLVSILYHECVHYALCAKNLRYKDEELIFDTVLNKLSIETNYQRIYPDVAQPYDLYTCNCGKYRRVYYGVKSPRKSLYETCDYCKCHPCFYRQEVGIYPEIVEKFSKETLNIDTATILK